MPSVFLGACTAQARIPRWWVPHGELQVFGFRNAPWPVLKYLGLVPARCRRPAAAVLLPRRLPWVPLSSWPFRSYSKALGMRELWSLSEN